LIQLIQTVPPSPDPQFLEKRNSPFFHCHAFKVINVTSVLFIFLIANEMKEIERIISPFFWGIICAPTFHPLAL